MQQPSGVYFFSVLGSLRSSAYFSLSLGILVSLPPSAAGALGRESWGRASIHVSMDDGSSKRRRSCSYSGLHGSGSQLAMQHV
jgi:hypothetical protein